MAAGWAQPARLLLLLLLAVVLGPPARADKPSRAGSAGAEASSAVFPLYGNVYPNGLYYVAMTIGNPAKPYFFDVDTGSDLTWLQCDAPCRSCNKVPHPLYRPTKDKLVPCVDPLCASLHGRLTGRHKCDSPQQQCDYQIRYADQGSSLGVLITDSFALRLANSSVVHPSIAFGCGYDQQVGSSSEAAAVPTDGVLGLGSGSISLLSQLKQHGITKNVVGHCLSTRGGGFLFFGDLVPNSHATWAPMARSAFRNYYSPGSASLYFGDRSLGVRPMEVVFDSGSSFTYFSAQPYQALVTALKGDLSKSLKEVSDHSLPLCWKGKKPFKSVFDVKKEFKSLVLSFSNGKAHMEIPPENYLIVTQYGNACLGILNGSEIGLKDLNIVGDITMQDQMVIYDNERGQIGWIRTPCDRIPKFGSSLL